LVVEVEARPPVFWEAKTTPEDVPRIEAMMAEEWGLD